MGFENPFRDPRDKLPVHIDTFPLWKKAFRKESIKEKLGMFGEPDIVGVIIVGNGLGKS